MNDGAHIVRKSSKVTVSDVTVFKQGLYVYSARTHTQTHAYIYCIY